MTPDEELSDIEKQISDLVKKTSVELYTELMVGSPKDTGNFVSDWKLTPTKPNNMGFLITNNVRYGPILWRGRRKVNGQWYGSLQGWGILGGDEFVNKKRVVLQNRLNKIEAGGKI